jgi:hypothetical protein
MGKMRRHVMTERTWVPLPDPAPGCEEPIYVSFPAPPDPEALAEAEGYLKGLEARGQIAREPGRPAPGATHELEIDGNGKKKLIRKRYSARR